MAHSVMSIKAHTLATRKNWIFNNLHPGRSFKKSLFSVIQNVYMWPKRIEKAVFKITHVRVDVAL